MTTVLALAIAAVVVLVAVVLHWLLCGAEGRMLRQALHTVAALQAERDEWKDLALRRVDELAAHRAQRNRREATSRG